MVITKQQFQELVYQCVALVPLGKVATYKQVACAIGKPKSYRAVGQALHKNPFAPMVPCHRVVASDGSLHGFANGLAAKKKLLEAEGIVVDEHNKIDLKRYCYNFK